MESIWLTSYLIISGRKIPSVPCSQSSQIPHLNPSQSHKYVNLTLKERFSERDLGFGARDRGRGGLTREGVWLYPKETYMNWPGNMARDHIIRASNSEPGKKRFSLAPRTYTIASDNQESRCLYIIINW